MPSIAELKFQEIVSAPDPAAFLRAMVNATPPVFEDEWFDFKGGTFGPAANQTPLPDATVKELWSKALCGFANTGGGVIVWGIDARPKPSAIDQTKTVDAAADVRLVPDPLALKSRLMAVHHTATDPPVSGIRVEAVTDPARGGFVVCFIPESKFKPHRAEWASQQYYFRIGDDFVVMPPSVLRAMFYPRLSPTYAGRITARFRDFQHGAGNSAAVFEISIDIQNVGTATAREPFVLIQTGPQLLQAAEIADHHIWRPMRLTHGSGLGLQLDSSIHPGARAPVIRATFPTGQLNLATFAGYSVTFTVFALDAEPQSFIVQFSRDELGTLSPYTREASRKTDNAAI